MAAFDALPPAVRAALRDHDYGVPGPIVVSALTFLRMGASVEFVLEAIARFRPSTLYVPGTNVRLQDLRP